jgi:hypothetical protein
MVFELLESEDLPNHSPIVSDLNVFEQHAILSCRFCE